jgi:hypothetical protein
MAQYLNPNTAKSIEAPVLITPADKSMMLTLKNDMRLFNKDMCCVESPVKRKLIEDMAAMSLNCGIL